MITQLAIDFNLRPCMGKEDFMVAKPNIEAVTMIDNWPDWPFFAVCIYGPEGSGKTHLANVFSNNVSIKTNYPYKIPVIKAKNLKPETPYELFKQHNCLIIEDLENLNDFETLFHTYNLYKNENGFILFTSRIAPARLTIPLADLRSRLNAMPAIEIKEPDDELLNILIIKLFSDRQIIVSPEIVSYILKNMERSFSYARKLVSEIDNISLELQRAVSVSIVKEAINSLSRKSQGELFRIS